MSSRAHNSPGTRQLSESDSDETSATGETAADVEAESTTETVDLSLDTIFEILKNQRRRYVLRYLRESAGTVQLNELADQVAAWENDKDIGLVTSNERKRVYVGLYQCHLTKMDDAGVVAFDQYRGTIEVRPAVHQLYDYIDYGAEDEATPAPAWDRYYTGVGVSALVLAGVAFALPSVPLGLLGFLLTAVVSVTVIGLTAANRLHDRDISLSPVPTALATTDEA
jgi:hypothetical protein